MCQNLNQVENGRIQLRFSEEVQTRFNYLVDTYDFRCVKVETTFVRYESDHIFINIYHGRSSFEIGLEIGQLFSGIKNEDAYNLSWLIKLDDSKKAMDYRLYVAKSADLVKKGIYQLCELFKEHAGEAIIGDEHTFKLLAKLREDWSESFAQEIMAGQVRPKANTAFSKKNYAEATYLYESISSELTPAELKKLKFARKQR